MIRLRRVLFPTDFSSSADRAFDLALLLAQSSAPTCTCSTRSCCTRTTPTTRRITFPDSAEIHERLEGLADSAMSRQLARGTVTEAQVRRVKSRGIAAAPTILEYAEEWDADLIVMGTEGRRGPSHLLLGSVAEEVSSHARCPVLTVRAGEAEALGPLERILAPVDLSDHSRQSLRVARALAERFGARLQVLHVVEDVIYPSYFGPTIDVTRELDRRGRPRPSPSWSGRSLGEQPVEQSVVVGHRAAPEIVEFARKNGSDLVVVASHGLGGLEEFLFGSTAKRIVQTPPCRC